MKALALAALLASSAALADESVDAPVAVASRVELHAGQPAPADGCFLDRGACVAAGSEIAGCRAEREALKGSIGTPLALTVGLVVLGLVVGGAVGWAAHHN